MTAGGEGFSTRPAIAKLVGGAIAQPLTPVDLPDVDVEALYYVTESIEGSPAVSYYVAVPVAPAGSRTVSDSTSVQGTATVTSATAAFVDGDEGSIVWSPSFPVGTTILEVVSGTQATLSALATATGTALDLIIGASVELAELSPLAPGQ